MLMMSGSPSPLIENKVEVARVLAEKAKAGRDAGDLVRPYLLYVEAAKWDPSNEEYQRQRDLLGPAAKLLLKYEKVSIKKDIVDAEFDLADRVDQQAEVKSDPVLKARTPAEKPRDQVASDTAAYAKPVEEVAFDSSPPDKTSPPLQTQAPAPDPTNKPLPPNDNPTQTDKPNSWSIAYATQVLGYGTYNSIRSNSVFNPGNHLADFPREDFHVALRPDLKFTDSIFSFSAKPRLDYNLGQGSSRNDVESYLQEWSVRLQALPSLNISYGREVPMWGPAMSLPASNPFFRDNNRNTPLLEIGARDFGRIVWQPNSKFAISYIANTALRRGTPDFLPFRPTAAVKADYNGKNFLFSGIYSAGISSPFGQRKFVGGYLQVSAGEALRFYVDGSAQQGNPGYFAQDSATPLGLGYSQTKINNALTPRTIVGGFAYTDTLTNTWTGEYIYNPFGYSHQLANDFYQTAQGLSGAYLMGGTNAGLAAEQLSLTANPGIGPLRRNYIFGQYQRNGIGKYFDVVLRYTFSADDRSGEGVAYVTWNTSDHLQLFAVFAGMDGSLDTEFARYLHYQAELGVRIFLH